MIRSAAVFLGALLLWAAPTASTVRYAAEPQTVKAGKPDVVELRFQIADGFHVNSHTPKSEFLIPTALKTQPADGITLAQPEYSAGQEYSFSFSPNEKLDVYSGTFTVRLPVTAAAGEHIVNATLRYQACDHAACYPPKSLPLQVPFTAK
ncbi:MAG TPA: protein-disulfide reductase DsbD N-terminal domain-containing protein [Granulicella sp.]